MVLTLFSGALCAAAPLATAQGVTEELTPSGSTAATAEEIALAPDGPEPPATRPPPFPKMVLLDTRHVLTAPLRWQGRDWLIASAGAAAVAGLSLADESLSDAARDHGPTLGFVGDTLEGMGDARSFVLLGGFYLAGAIGRDSKAKNVCLDGLAASLIASGIITPVVATLTGRERPTEERGAYSFHPFSGRSFPSGHTTQAFAVASVIATSYDQLWVKMAAYGAASFTAYARVQKGKHFPTDVVVGAVIGTAVGRSVVHFNRTLRSGEKEPESTGARLTVLPLVSGDTLGVSATLDF